jgi:hypothetical protein
MGCLSKGFSLLIILILAVSSLIMVKPTCAQSVAKLPLPEFTVKYFDRSYNIPASTSIDPYTGKSVENPAKHVENRTIQFTIKNQAISSGNLHFIIRIKGYFSQNWTAIYDGWAGWAGNPNSSIPEPSSLVWEFSTLRPSGAPGAVGWFYRGGDSFYLPSEGQVDFQVKAQTWGEVMATTSPQNPFGGSITTLFGESDWSNTQTISIGETSASPTPTATVPEFSSLAIQLSLITMAAVAGLLVYFKKHKGSHNL